MEVENIKTMSLRLMTSMISGGADKEDIAKYRSEGQKALGCLLSAVQGCQTRYGGKTELATEDDVKISELCDRWAAVLSHGLRPPQLTSAPSSIQNIVSAGINFAFNINYIGTSLWNYARLHLTRHEEERFKNLKQINTPMGHFKAFLRASLNERSLERYLYGWVGHSLVTEYYEDWALMRDSEATSLLPNMAAGLMCVLFALSIDKAELNEIQPVLPQGLVPVEPVIAVKTPMMKANLKKKSLRQVISFDTKEDENEEKYVKIVNNKTLEKSPVPALSSIATQATSWNSAPPTCVSSPDSNSVYTAYSLLASQSEPTTSNYEVKGKHFFSEDSLSSSEKVLSETPGQILARLSERARDIFSSKKSLTGSQKDSDISSVSGKGRLSESDSEGGPGEGSVSCLELCFPEDEVGDVEDGHLQGRLTKQQEENLSLQLRITQLEMAHREKCSKMEKTVMDLNRENERLKDQLRKYVSAVQMLKQDGSQSDEVKQYESKLVQVAEMHAELMEFNEFLQRRLLASGAILSPSGEPGTMSAGLNREGASNVQIWIPSAFLITSGSKSFHVYQIFLKIFSEEWNVYRRYSEFRKLYSDLRNTHPDISPFKFPPKKALGKKEAWVVERRRSALAAWLSHVSLALPQLRQASTKAQLISLLPFFGDSNGGTLPGSPLRPAASS